MSTELRQRESKRKQSNNKKTLRRSGVLISPWLSRKKAVDELSKRGKRKGKEGNKTSL